MKKVRYEEMMPHEIAAARKQKPVAYLSIGGIEWHGEQNPVGLDTVKAHELCIRAAQKGGGLAMPALFWGESRESGLLEFNHDEDGKVAEKMGLPKENFAPGYMGGVTVEQEHAFYEQLLTHIYYQLKSLGFRVIFVLCGHYPLKPFAERTAQQFMERNRDIRIYAGIEADPVRDIYPKGGDHAGKWETSIMRTLRPELVDVGVLPEDKNIPLIGVYGEDPRSDDLEEFGRKVTQDIINRMVAKTNEMLKELELL
jgi:creatinine amidohydrolase